ncbi:hypothetical protein JG491_20145 [Streptomyces sp. CRPSP2-6A1]|uniref:hypothetical protein n=1 Tax=Streptomyces sp. CRPSP2-6A1 TaxID=2799588 RepID=UPI0018F0667C|nr:hypothetical protein [Streptomyces sp. CRPSP2-6A1]MBJ7002349.1 hypothetical protein [Streptomyces sp. CRPSP2-6A1]
MKSYINALNPKTTNLVTVGYNADQAVRHTAFTKSWSYWAIGGKAHEDVAANLARFWWAAPNSAVVEDTWTWQNAAAGGAATATYGPTLWSTEGTLSPQASTCLSQEAASVSVVEAFGGNSSCLPANRTAIGDAIAASGAWTSTIRAAGGDGPGRQGPGSARRGRRGPRRPSAARHRHRHRHRHRRRSRPHPPARSGRPHRPLTEQQGARWPTDPRWATGPRRWGHRRTAGHRPRYPGRLTGSAG